MTSKELYEEAVITADKMNAVSAIAFTQRKARMNKEAQLSNRVNKDLIASYKEDKAMLDKNQATEEEYEELKEYYDEMKTKVYIPMEAEETTITIGAVAFNQTLDKYAKKYFEEFGRRPINELSTLRNMLNEEAKVFNEDYLDLPYKITSKYKETTYKDMD